MTERFIIDDAGTLIDIRTRETYDYVSDVLPILNKLNNEIIYLNEENAKLLSERINDFEQFEETVDFCEKLKKENEKLKMELYYDGDSVCNICKHQYLVETEKYYVAKCEKEHEKCSKEDIKYCEDFKFKELEE